MLNPRRIIKWLENHHPDWINQKTYPAPGHLRPTIPIGRIVAGYILRTIIGSWRRAIRYWKKWDLNNRKSQNRRIKKYYCPSPNISAYIHRLQRHFGKDYEKVLAPIALEFRKSHCVDWDKLDLALVWTSRKMRQVQTEPEDESPDNV